MKAKGVILLLMLATVSFSQDKVNISGTVKDSRTSKPISGASVRLSLLELTATTDSDGNFNILKTSIRQNRKSDISKNPAKESRAVFFRQEVKGPALVQIFDLSGRHQKTLFSGTLESGSWQIIPPRLLPGVYFYVFDTPQKRHTARILITDESFVTHEGYLKKVSGDLYESMFTAIAEDAPQIKDTIVVEKSGYRSARVPIDSYELDQLIVGLEDVTSSVLNSTIIPDPSWTCFMPDGIPPPELGDELFEITLNYSTCHDVGITKFGQRYQYDIDGGEIKGERINATILKGGLDYELVLSSGSVEVEQINIFRTKDNTPVLMRNAGVSPQRECPVRVVLDFEAPNSSSYKWLNSGKFAATRIIDSAAKAIKMKVFDISTVVLPQSRVQIKDPEDVPNQTWDCVKITGRQGQVVFTENVALGNSISIGASKRGSRNIIPITGGTMSGRVKGKILPGGADYQLSGLDARYTLETDDGVLIIVRNCGSGALIPVFETKTDGPYSFLNENKYLSSAPGMSGGGVSITFYEAE
jgi:hypothetical protein